MPDGRLDLTGKVAIVTGGGAGREPARGFGCTDVLTLGGAS